MFVVTAICVILLLALTGMFGNWLRFNMTEKAKIALANFKKLVKSRPKFYNIKPTAVQARNMLKLKTILRTFTVRVTNVKYKLKPKKAVVPTPIVRKK